MTNVQPQQTHQHDWLRSDVRLTIKISFEDWLGPISALVTCGCGDFGILQLIAWRGRRLEERIFSLREVEKTIAETYLANISRDYCDLSRKQDETTALINTSNRTGLLLEVQLPDLMITQRVLTDDNPPIATGQSHPIDPDAWVRWFGTSVVK
jgi:hypothetical protein